MNEQNLWAVLLIGGTLSVFNVVLTSMGLERVQNSHNLHQSSSPTVKFSGVVVSDPSRGDRHMEVNKKERERESGHEMVRSSRKKGLKRGTSRRRKSPDMQKDRPPIAELPPDAVVIDLGDSDQERLPADTFDGGDDLEVGRKHGRYDGSGRRREHLYRNEPRWERHMPQSHLRLRKRMRHKTPESGVRERGILKRTAGREVKVRDGKRKGRSKDKTGWSDRKEARSTKKKKRRRKHDEFGATHVVQI